jgi:uncharacterized protein (TIGR02647 family)
VTWIKHVVHTIRHNRVSFYGTFADKREGFVSKQLDMTSRQKNITKIITREEIMNLNNELVDEMDLLMKFDLSSARVGLKVHSNADPKVIAAAKRLYAKDLVEHEDGGFLTTLGHEAAEHLQAARVILTGVTD